MTLSPGVKIGPYEVLSALGSGGMGEVYRARDTRLNRDVAIKILPEFFASDPERLARFQREAEVLASLNHPNIAHLHGLEESATVRALVMELVEGDDLSQRLTRGAIPLDEALPIAKQIADALEAAHDRGIVHRDLKPANIKIRPDGTVKVLDFGLAKAIEPASGSGLQAPGGATNSPTITLPAMTAAGMILGTAAYMAPEQAKGRPADKRSDIWAFGAVLYEMLTGTRAFAGDDVSETLASVLKTDPEWAQLPAETPARVRQLLRRCLVRDPRKRIPEIAIARFEIEDVLSGAAVPPDPASTNAPKVVLARRRAFGLVLAMMAGALISIGVAWLLWPKPAPPDIVKFALPLGPTFAAGLNVNADDDIAISSDGTHLAYVIGGTIEDQQIFVRALDQLQSVAVGGVGRRRSPFFSPDGRWLGYSDGTSLFKVPVTGGPPVTICKLTALPRGASWGLDGTIIFGTNAEKSGLFRVSSEGGTPEVLTTPDPAKGERLHELPEILPSGRAVLFTIDRTGEVPGESTQVAVLDLATRQWKVIVLQGSNARYARSGHLVYAVPGSLRAVPFDLERLEVRGDFRTVVDRLVTKDGSGAADFSIASNGTLAYVNGERSGRSGRRTLVWVDRNGKEESINVPPRSYVYARLSPDGTRVALDSRDDQNDIWIWYFDRQILQRLTNDPGMNRSPVWTWDSKRVAFSAVRDGVESIYWQAFDGSGTMERLSSGTQIQNPSSFSRDDQQLLFVTPVTNPYDVGVLALGAKPSSTLLLHTTFNETNAEFSPDGHWLAYSSNETNRDEIYVRPFPNVDASRRQVSTAGGTRPLWSSNGRELFYNLGDTIMVVTVRVTGDDLVLGSPQVVVKGYSVVTGTSGRHYDVSPDGKRFLMLKDVAQEKAAPPELRVVVNWLEELKQRVPIK